MALVKISEEVKEKYEVVNNAFRQVVKSDPKDLVVVEIGDTKQPDNFLPQIKICRWGDNEETNEVNCSIRLKDFDNYTLSTDGEKIKLIGATKEVHFYDIAPCEEHPEGAYEFEVILKEKPITNKIEFTLNTKGLDFFYQPELTPEEIKQGANRPENVVGSYAVYASENKINYVGGKLYRAGKVGQIFRPKIIDSVGTEVWGDLHIENGILSVTIPQEFLDKAVYPIRHAAGLLFGYDTVGTSGSDNPYNSLLIGTKFTGVVGDAVSISFYIWAGGYGPYDAKGVLVTHSNHTKVTNGVGSAVSYSGNFGWKTSSFATAPTLSAIDYDICIASSDEDVASEIKFDFAGAGIGFYFDYYDPDYWSTLVDPTTGVHTQYNDDFKYSIYCTYTAGGGAAVVGGWKTLLGVGG